MEKTIEQLSFLFSIRNVLLQEKRQEQVTQVNTLIDEVLLESTKLKSESVKKESEPISNIRALPTQE